MSEGEPNHAQGHASRRKGAAPASLLPGQKGEENYQVWAQGHSDNTFASKLTAERSNQ